MKQEDIIKKIEVAISKDAFNGPFKCHGRSTSKAKRRMVIRGLETEYEVWECRKCGTEYLDTAQAVFLEKLWKVRRLLEDKAVSVERSLNFDGKSFFVRLPREFSQAWMKNSHARITLLDSDEFLVQVVK